MRKSIVLPGLALIVVALIVAGSAGASRHAGTFKYCTDPTFPPMELANASGKITGFDVDMAQQLSLTWGANAVAVKTAFPGLIPALNSKRCDAVISGIFITPDRLKEAGAVAYMHSHRVIIAAAGNPKHITRPASLKGLHVVVQGGTKYEVYLKAIQKKIGFSLLSYPVDNDAVAQVLLGRADAVLTQDTSYAYQAGKHPGKLAIAYTFGAPDAFGVYFRKGDAVGKQIDDGLRVLRSTGKLKTLATKYKIPVGDVG